VVSKPDGYIEVYTTLPPAKNLANKALLGLLAGHFDILKSSIRILKGFTSKNKVIEISDET